MSEFQPCIPIDYCFVYIVRLSVWS